MVVAGASSGGVAAYYYLTLPPPTYSVPSLTGDLPGQAASALGTRHLELVVSGHDWSATTPSGRVLSQFPGRGSRLHAKQVVTVVLSRGPEPVAVPSLATLDLAQARSALVGQRLVLGTVAHVHSMTVPAGSVISWSATGRKVLPGTAVNVVLSAGKPRATVPSSAVGSSYSVLASQLAALHLGVHELEQYDSSVAAGLVLSTSPAPGTSQVVGTVVTVDVSLGPHLVTIPSAIVGMSQGAATQVKPGDTVEALTPGGQRVVEVTGIVEKRVGAPAAAACYEDRTPPRPVEEASVVNFTRDWGAGRPTKRDRRQLERARRA